MELWVCDRCTFAENAPDQDQCEACEQPRAKRAKVSSQTTQWPCSACTFENSVATRACEVCGSARPGLQKHPALVSSVGGGGGPAGREEAGKDVVVVLDESRPAKPKAATLGRPSTSNGCGSSSTKYDKDKDKGKHSNDGETAEKEEEVEKKKKKKKTTTKNDNSDSSDLEGDFSAERLGLFSRSAPVVAPSVPTPASAVRAASVGVAAAAATATATAQRAAPACAGTARAQSVPLPRTRSPPPPSPSLPSAAVYRAPPARSLSEASAASSSADAGAPPGAVALVDPRCPLRARIAKGLTERGLSWREEQLRVEGSVEWRDGEAGATVQVAVLRSPAELCALASEDRWTAFLDEIRDIHESVDRVTVLVAGLAKFVDGVRNGYARGEDAGRNFAHVQGLSVPDLVTRTFVRSDGAVCLLPVRTDDDLVDRVVGLTYSHANAPRAVNPIALAKARRREASDSEAFADFLAVVPDISVMKSRAIAQHFPSFRALAEAYQRLPDRGAQRLMLQDIVAGKNAVGQAASRKIHTALFYRGDPSALVKHVVLEENRPPR